MTPRYKKVYIILPTGATGGVELGHQLVDFINTHGGEAYVVYQNGNKILKDAQVTPAYAGYNIRVANEIEDSEENMLVLPELYFDWMYRYGAIKLGMWWMSVDNHFKQSHWLDSLRFYDDWKTKLLRSHYNIKTRVRNSLAEIRRNHRRIYHFYQSAYAQNFLYNNGMGRAFPLGDYINPETYTLSDLEAQLPARENLVLYNPKKGISFTRRLLRKNPDIEFVPLQGFTRSQLNDLMRRAKLYIDFGNFPGKDRLPREAVMNGMCIITGTLGASKFYEDVAIDSDYKFEVKSKNIPAISQKIRKVLADFDSHSPDFDTYRERIAREKDEFGTQISNFFFREDPA